MNKETLPQIGVSETLRMARERTGQDLRFVADMLRIRYAYLEAIENGEYQKLPGAPYAIGFVRAYADHLNLNSVEIVERFKRERADLDEQTQLVFPKPLPEGKVPSGGILLVAVILGVFVYGAWFFLSGQDKPIVELIPEIPARLMALVGAGEEDAAETVAAGPEESAPDAPDPIASAAPEPAPAEAEASDDPVAGEKPSETGPEPEVAAMSAESGGDTAATPAETAAADETPTVPGEPDQPAVQPVAPGLEEPVAGAEETAAPPGAPAAGRTEDAGSVSEEAAVAPEAPISEPVTDGPEPAVATDEPAQTPPTVAEASPVPEPDPVADSGAVETPAVAAAQPPGAGTAETEVAAAPEIGETQVPAPADEDSAAAIAQRVLEELEQTVDEPAAARSGGVNGDTGSVASATEPSSDEVPVAAITPAARPSEPVTPPETPAAAPENGAGAATPALMAGRPAGKVYGEENETSRILITARVDSWVEVSTQQGELLLTRVLRAGDSFRVPDRAGLSLVTGNAGGLAISVDGNQVPDLGPVGAVRRGVDLDPDRLIAGTAGNL